MKAWNSNGEAISNFLEIYNPWPDGAAFVLIEDESDIRLIHIMRRRFGEFYTDNIVETKKIGLYKRGGYDAFWWIAPVLEGMC